MRKKNPVWIPRLFDGCCWPAIRGRDRRFLNDLTLITPPPGLSSADYSMIEQAVMETARGRWFLLEYARRQRAAETQRLTDAIDRLEEMLAGAAPQAAVAHAPVPAIDVDASAALAERLSDLAWRLREDGAHPLLCAELDREVLGLRPARAASPAVEVPVPPQTAPPPLAAPPWERLSESAPPDDDRDPRARALARLDDLPLMEKLALFC